ncbi:MAG: MFS transporter [Bryobacteraceae bacterium]|nr:MFS transporter [Bryobacteraceae bacterium]
MAKSTSPNFALAVLTGINILNFYDRQVLGALAEPIRHEFHLNDEQIGLLSTGFILLYALVGVPLGRIADHWRRKSLLAWAILAWSALTASAALASTYSLLLASRLGFAVGEAAVAPAATSWLGDVFPPERRARALGIFMLGVPIGGAMSFFISGPIAQAYGWRAAMIAAAAPALLAILFLWQLEEPVRGAAETHVPLGGRQSTLDLLRIPTFRWIIASGALLNFNMYAIATFAPAFVIRVHHLSLAQAGVIVGLTLGAGGIAGGLLSGFVGDWVRGQNNGRLLAAAGLAIAGVPLAVAAILSPQVWLCICLLALFYAMLNSYYGLVYSSIQDVVLPARRGSAMALYFLAMYLCGAAFGPVLTGKLSDLLARRAAAEAGLSAVNEVFRAAGLQQAMLVMPVLSVLLALVLYAASRTVAADLTRRDASAQSIA